MSETGTLLPGKVKETRYRLVSGQRLLASGHVKHADYVGLKIMRLMTAGGFNSFRIDDLTSPITRLAC